MSILTGDPIQIMPGDFARMPAGVIGMYVIRRHENTSPGATIACFLIDLHAFAALLHYDEVQDDTLRRMLPSRFRVRATGMTSHRRL